MAADIQKLDLVDIDLNSGNIHRSWFNHSIGLGDIKANAFGVRVFRNGEPVNVAEATCQGVMMMPNGSNILIEGSSLTSVSGNTAYVILPQSAYAAEGQFALAIRLIGSGITGTMRIVDGVINNTGTSVTVEPGTEVPTSAQIIAAYNDAVSVISNSVRYDITQSKTATEKQTARENIQAASRMIIAPEFAKATANDAGSLVTKDGLLYYLPNGHTANTEWAVTTKTSVKIDDRLKSLSGDITTEAVNRAAGDASNLLQIAPVFAEATAYDAGQLVTNSGILYILPNGHTANTTWANTTKTAVKVASQLSELKSATSASNRIDNDRLKDVDGLKYIGELLATKRSSGYSNYEISLTANKRYKLFVQTTGGYKVFLRGSNGTTQVNFWFDNASAAYMAEVSGTGDHYLVPVSNASYIRITDNTTSDVRITVYEITTEGINEDISGLRFDADIDKSRLYGLDGLQFVGELTAKAKKAAYENYAVSLSNMVTYKMYVDTDSTFKLFARASDETTGIYCSVDGGEFVLQNSLSGSGEHTLQCNGSVSYIRITDNTTNDVRIEFYFDTGRNAGNLAPDTKTINCYGDSLTMGYGGEGTTFPSVLDGLLDSTYTVNNYGIGGETAQQIAGRQGGVPLIVPPVTLTHNSATTVTIKSYFGSDIDALFKQASGGKNPIMLNGHQVSQMYDGNNNTLWCYDNETLVVDRPSVLIPYSATQRNKTIIIWIGTNGWGNNSDVNTLVRMIDAMIEYNGNDNYIVIGLVTGENMPTFRASEQLFIETYGYHYIALREYLVNYGCSDAGITPTAEDQERAAQGLVPSSLLVDGVHFNAAGYTVIGTLVHRRGQELGLW